MSLDYCARPSLKKRAHSQLAAYELVMTDNHRSVIGEITHGSYQCREAGEVARA
jgi:hypothetical protein